MHHILYYIKKDMSSDLILVLPIKLLQLLQHSKSEGVILLMHIQSCKSTHQVYPLTVTLFSDSRSLRSSCTTSATGCQQCSTDLQKELTRFILIGEMIVVCRQRRAVSSNRKELHKMHRTKKYKNKNKVSFSTGNVAYMYNAMTYCTRSLF